MSVSWDVVKWNIFFLLFDFFFIHNLNICNHSTRIKTKQERERVRKKLNLHQIIIRIYFIHDVRYLLHKIAAKQKFVWYIVVSVLYQITNSLCSGGEIAQNWVNE